MQLLSLQSRVPASVPENVLARAPATPCHPLPPPAANYVDCCLQKGVASGPQADPSCPPPACGALAGISNGELGKGATQASSRWLALVINL